MQNTTMLNNAKANTLDSLGGDLPREDIRHTFASPVIPTAIEAERPDDESLRAMSGTREGFTTTHAHGSDYSRGALAAGEREALIKKNRKLAQIFGSEPVLMPTGSYLRRHYRSASEQPPAKVIRGPVVSPLVPTGELAFLANQDSPLRGTEGELRIWDTETSLGGGEDDSLNEVPSSLPQTPFSPSTVERRQKRERLAKLHRYLGSGVPTERVLGITGFMRDLDLPVSTEVQKPEKDIRPTHQEGGSMPKGDDTDGGSRMSEQLSGKEKSTNVRRAWKMGKVFGDNPPQALFHTQATSNSAGSSSVVTPSVQIQQSYTLLYDDDHSRISHDSQQPLTLFRNETFRKYRDSLNSLDSIVDDRESIGAVHRLLSLEEGIEDVVESPGVDLHSSGRSSPASFVAGRLERRRSLPSLRSESLLSVSSSSLTTSPSPQQTSFQVRRKRAAKLSEFFGVDCRTLFDDVLAAFEIGVAEESGRGNLKPQETELLLDKLRRLKSKNVANA